jgi:hypothetical protein
VGLRASIDVLGKNNFLLVLQVHLCVLRDSHIVLQLFPYIMLMGFESTFLPSAA